MKFSVGILSLMLLFSCGPQVFIDYDKQAQWPSAKTYGYASEQPSGLSELDEKRLINAIDSVLSTQGYTRSTSNQLLIDFYVNETISSGRNSIGIGLGTGGGNVNVGGGVGIPIGGTVINQAFTIEIYDTTEGYNLLWQAIIEDELKENASPNVKDLYYTRMIEKGLQDFPPKND
ncbi:MAG: DUF4136 domain-containing protein [Flavobacteriaceae bacterium]|nr:DUF4136 domain-containing protein [Flavobacteriaceae bacterium]